LRRVCHYRSAALNDSALQRTMTAPLPVYGKGWRAVVAARRVRGMPVLTTKRTGGGGDSAARLPTRKQGYGFALRDRRLGGYKFSREGPIGSCIPDFFCPGQMLWGEGGGGQHCRIHTDALA